MKLTKEKKYYHDRFFEIAMKFLKKYPEEESYFKKHWKEKQYRKAAVFFYMEMPKEERDKLTEEEKEIAGKFYEIFIH